MTTASHFLLKCVIHPLFILFCLDRLLVFLMTKVNCSVFCLFFFFYILFYFHVHVHVHQGYPKTWIPKHSQHFDTLWQWDTLSFKVSYFHPDKNVRRAEPFKSHEGKKNLRFGSIHTRLKRYTQATGRLPAGNSFCQPPEPMHIVRAFLFCLTHNVFF